MASKANNDEYTDYSCSTSMERLARDVETLLRSWHVDKGNDRHISAQNHSTLLLRQDALVWNVSLTDRMGRPVSFSVELQLTLWDGPAVEDEEEEAVGLNLPHSLRRSSRMIPLKSPLFENLSLMFGIGQHITLTPRPQSIIEMQEELKVLVQSTLHRHDDEITARWSVFQVLSGWLQTALNVAVANCQCCIPVFGIWGLYELLDKKRRRNYTQEGQELSLWPSWMQHLADSRLVGLPRMSRVALREIFQLQNQQSLPSLLEGLVLPTFFQSANFSLGWMPPLKELKPMLLTTWGNLLLQHTPDDDDTVVLWNARHVFGWWKQPVVPTSVFQQLFKPDNYHYESEHNPYTAWRRKRNNEKPNQQEVIDLTGMEDSVMEVYVHQEAQYQDECRSMAVALLDQASGSSAGEPRWGPVDDPVAALHATVTWNGTQSNRPEDASSPPVPLLSFPLRIRSQHSMSDEDWHEMEESVERTILDPQQSTQTQFQLQAWWDLETPVASLAAAQQCLLAALIRTSTLSDQTVLKHLTDDDVLGLWDTESGNVVAACLAQQAQVGPAVAALVDAMDWVTSAEDKMDLRDAEILVRHILQPDNGSDFPLPPISPLAATATAESPRHRRPVAAPSPKAAELQANANPFAPLFKSAPIGRLVSILCVHMARLRSPCSMSMLWIAFCHEVRIRWEHRVALPHMNFVPGLDPSGLEMKERNRCLTSLGVKADQAAYWHVSKNDGCVHVDMPDTEFPGDHHCLIGQKLKVVNLCIDIVTSQDEERQRRKMEKRRKLDSSSVSSNGNHKVGRVKITHELGEAVTSEEDDDNTLPANEPSERFEDALSEATEDDAFVPDNSAAAVVAAAKRSMEFSKNDQPARKGARCPVPGCSLVTTGDQLYAPYLQRPYPLTDDVIAERHTMLSRHYEPTKSSQHQSIYKRLEISYRLQKPKLLSDMCAFKAANPSSVFQDFINWYGNPGNPLDDYSDKRNLGGSSAAGNFLSQETFTGSAGKASKESVAVKLEKASEAIQMLNETREFWSRTWEEATPLPASEQKLLFDVTSTVEMALDFMENMHPAILINQIMAVNLAVSYFTLMGAAKEVGAVNLGGLVQRAYQRLREKTEHALELLAKDATSSTSSSFSGIRHEGASNFISLPAISACDKACTALSEAEVLTARATSLLHKFPEQYELVESIIRNNPGQEINLQDPKAQSQVLSAIQQQQHQLKAQKSVPLNEKTGVQPALREYVLNNLDDSHPCQLSVRYSDKSVMFNNSTNSGTLETTAGMGGMIVALTKSQTE